MTEYKCDFCGKTYKTAAEYAKCVAKCAGEYESREREKRRKQLEAEKEARKAAILDAEKNLNAMHQNYYNDYHEFVRHDRHIYTSAADTFFDDLFGFMRD